MSSAHLIVDPRSLDEVALGGPPLGGLRVQLRVLNVVSPSSLTVSWRSSPAAESLVRAPPKDPPEVPSEISSAPFKPPAAVVV